MNPATASQIQMEIELFHQPAIDRARKMIMWAGAIYIAIPIFLFALLAAIAGPKVFASEAFLVMFSIGGGVFAMHIALAQWAKTSPLPATSIALGVFLAYNAIAFAVGETGSPILIAIGLFILGRGVLASYRAHKLRRAAA